MRWITETLSVTLGALALAGSLASCATTGSAPPPAAAQSSAASGAAGSHWWTRREIFADEAAAIAALAGRNPNGVYRSILLATPAEAPAQAGTHRSQDDRWSDDRAQQ